MVERNSYLFFKKKPFLLDMTITSPLEVKILNQNCKKSLNILFQLI